MGIVQRFERRLQGAVGDGLARVFGGGVVPKEVEAELQREASDRLQELPGGGLLAPNNYIVSISQSDYDQLASDHELTTRAFAKHLTDHLADQGWQTYGDVRVAFEPSPTLHTGQFRTRGTVDPDVGRPPPGPVPASRLPDRPSANPLSGAGPMTQNSGYDPDNERRGRAEYPGESRGARGFATPLSAPNAGRGGYQNGGGYPPEQDRAGYQNGYDQPAGGGYQNGYDQQGGGYTQTQGYGREAGAGGGYGAEPGYGAQGGDRGGYGAEPGYGAGGAREGYNGGREGYGATPEPGYGGAAADRGGYGAEPAYGEPGYGGAGADRGGYGSQAGGYNDHGGSYGEQAYDRGGYGAEPAGYNEAGGYGGASQASTGYAQPGYGQQPQGYDRGGYGAPEPGYGQPPAAGRGGGAPAAGGYAPASQGGGAGYATGFTATLQLDDGSGRTYQLREGSNIIGRGQDAHFRLPDTGVSRRHIEVRWDGQVAMLSDLGSTNGTLVNGSPVQDWQLADGDVIRAGHSEILIRIL